MPKSQLDWLAVVGLWIGAVVMAIKAGDLPLSNGAPSWLASHLWGYLPFILVTFYLVVALNRLRLSPARPQPSSTPKIAEQVAPAISDAQAQQDEIRTELGKTRTILPRKITTEYLFDLRAGKTDIQLSRALSPFLGKWLFVTGEVLDVAVSEKRGEIHIGLKGMSPVDRLGKLITGFFERDLDRLEMYEKNDDVMVFGCLKSVNSLGMQLTQCELVD